MLKLPWNLNDTATKDLFEKEETLISKRSERFLETETNLDRNNALKKSYEHVHDQASVSQNTSVFHFQIRH